LASPLKIDKKSLKTRFGFQGRLRSSTLVSL